MKRLLLIIILLTTNNIYSEETVTYDSLVGVWSYFHIGGDNFAFNKLIGTEQRLFFQDRERVILQVIAKEQDFHQDTSYQLRYSLSLRDNVPYLSLFSDESEQVLGAFVRKPYKNSLEMASDPGFVYQRQLYQRKDMILNPGNYNAPNAYDDPSNLDSRQTTTPIKKR